MSLLFSTQETLTSFDTTRFLASGIFDGSSGYLSRTWGTTGDRQKHKGSVVFKLCKDAEHTLWSAASASADIIRVRSTGQLRLVLNGGSDGFYDSNELLRDYGAWYHLYWELDTTAQTFVAFINGQQLTFSVTTAITLNHNTGWLTSGVLQTIGRNSVTASEFHNGYMHDFRVVDASAAGYGSVDINTFGKFSTEGIWFPSIPDISDYGEGVVIVDPSTGADTGGNNYNFTVNGTIIASADTGSNNHCMYSHLYKSNAGGFTLSTGNLTFAGASNNTAVFGTQSARAGYGKYVWEVTINADPAAGAFYIGAHKTSNPAVSASFVGLAGSSAYQDNGTKWENGSNTAAAGATYTTGDVIRVELNMVNEQVEYFKNGVSQFTTALTAGEDYTPALDGSNTGWTATTNFGASSFVGTPSTNFTPFNTRYAPTPVLQGKNFFKTKLYSGTSATASYTGVGFRGDVSWHKSLNGATDWRIMDRLRGSELGNRELSFNTNAVEGNALSRGVSYDADGFTVDFTVGTGTEPNTSANNYAAFMHKAGGAGSSNTDGTITSSVSVSASGHMSIVTYTGNGTAGATVGHGLGQAPKLVIIKRRNVAADWIVGASPLGWTNHLVLNSTAGSAAGSHFNNTAPSASVVTLGNVGPENSNTDDFIMYCFTSVVNVSAVDTYTGNASADGPFIETNYAPAFALGKRTDTVGDWFISDITRPWYSGASTVYPNLTSVETANQALDLVSSGIKIRNTDAAWNAAGGTYLIFTIADLMGGGKLPPLPAR